MRLISLLLLLFCGHVSIGQTFLDSYKSFQLEKIKSDKVLDSIRKTDYNKTLHLTKKLIKQNKVNRKRLLNDQILQFDTIFKSYHKKTGFNFNTADSFTLVYQTGIETNLSDYIFWTNKDTISYGELWFVATLHSTKRIIQYKPFLDTTQLVKGIRIINDRDSLLTLASKKDCETAQQLSKENPVLDGMRSTILFVKKADGKFLINECYLQPFGFVPIWRKE
jgi:hypothetical protein